ncbi:MAG: serine hydrolase [Bergeyella sp.]|nr:serine hydrolase [Bergeyella sp.]
MKSPKIILVLFVLSVLSCRESTNNTELLDDIKSLTKNKKLNIGLSVKDDNGNEILSINGNKKFKLYSVGKYFSAVYLFHLIDRGILSLDQNITFSKEDLNPDLYSPLQDSIPDGGNITLKQAINYSVKRSDNNVFDKLTKVSGGFAGLNSFICSVSPCNGNFSMKSLYKNPNNTMENNIVTPKYATTILNKVNNGSVISERSNKLLKRFMMHSVTDTRIQGIIKDKTISFHKSGTSGRVNGTITSVNDIGIVSLKNEKTFSIAVFISNSKESDETNDRLIAEITYLVYKKLN